MTPIRSSDAFKPLYYILPMSTKLVDRRAHRSELKLDTKMMLVLINVSSGTLLKIERWTAVR